MARAAHDRGAVEGAVRVVASGGHVLPHHVQNGGANHRVFDGAREEEGARVLHEVAHHLRALALVRERVGPVEHVPRIDERLRPALQLVADRGARERHFRRRVPLASV